MSNIHVNLTDLHRISQRQMKRVFSMPPEGYRFAIFFAS